MISSSKAITLVLISTATILAGYHTFDRAYNEDAVDDWTTGPTTRSSSGYSHSYYGHHSGGSSGFFGSSGSSSAHGTSHGGFGGHGHGGS